MKNFYNTKFLVGPGAYLVPAQKIIPGRILYIQPGKLFFTPEQPLRTKFSGEPEPYYSCKTFRFAQPGESNRISADL